MSEIIMSGVNLMVMGMGTVFVFLAVLVFGTTLMSQIILRLPNSTETETKPSSQKRTEKQDDLTEVAAVAAAARLFHDR